MWRALALAAALLVSGSARAEDKGLEARVKALEERLGGAGTVAETGGVPISLAYDDGLHFRSGDGKLDFTLNGDLITHGTFYQHGEARGKDTFTIKEAQVTLEGKMFERWLVHVGMELRPGAEALYEGYVEFDVWGLAKLRAGQFLLPYSEEAFEYVKWQDMPENSLVDLHAPGRDIGIMAYSELFSGVLDYSVGVYNGNGPLGSDDNSDKEVAATLGVSPLAWVKLDWLRHFHIGVAATSGRHTGNANELPLPPLVPASGSEVQTGSAGMSPGFTPVREDGRRQRASADLALTVGPVEFNTQISNFTTGLDSDGSRSRYRSWGNRWSLGFWLGGSRDSGHRPTVDHPLFDGGPGAFQFVARYSTLTMDDDYLKRAGFAGTERVREFAVCANWYPNSHVRVSVMLTDVKYSRRGIPVGDPLPLTGTPGVSGNDRFARLIDDEKVLIVRVQVDF
ncbi:MAG: OprO/OprP family phosphate-selective porin [Planctomycetes bacterium]|nr:OprO/OprP family phosphate-selective porin [Planctomycetota bacterium]